MTSSGKRERAARLSAARPARGRIEASAGPRCANCAGEVQAGAVRSRGSVFCSIECALAATVPGVYLG
ncbi:MAG TPA: hypothetical protein VNG93_02015 [Candidatus Dormibacteraeota bacterium]|nr:hypothetical protein [Candidatus Dormibacteraeota bacterium]